MSKKIYILDGKNFFTRTELLEEVGKVLFGEAHLVHDLNALNDVLEGGYGTPEEGFVLIWRNWEISKNRFGYDETVRTLGETLKKCRPADRSYIKTNRLLAKQGKGRTFFDMIVEIFESHESDGVEFRLEAEDYIDYLEDHNM
jgi:RNAse (barnase) inhibitor barstar